MGFNKWDQGSTKAGIEFALDVVTSTTEMKTSFFGD